MSKKPEKSDPPVKQFFKKPPKDAGFWQVFWYKSTVWAVKHRFWQRFAWGLLAFIIFATGFVYGVGQWYINKHKDEPLVIGTTFISDYAKHFDLDPRETLAATLGDLGLKRVRLVSYWENHEPERGQYDFSDLDWQFDMAEQYGAKVSLAIGLRQPRWPECHMPDWASKLTNNEWREPLYKYIETVVNRYKDRPSLESYQLENEFFLEVFGMCNDFDRNRLVYEFDMVKTLDPNTKLIVNRSNNAVPSWPMGEPRADEVGAAVYKRVWDKTVTQRYFEYPLPAWYYSFMAGMTELTTDRETFIHELQTEPWVDERIGGVKDVSVEEQYKTMSPERFVSRLQYGIDTGMRTIDLWGTEWWYWLKVQRNAPEMWDTAKAEFQRINMENEAL